VLSSSTKKKKGKGEKEDKRLFAAAGTQPAQEEKGGTTPAHSEKKGGGERERYRLRRVAQLEKERGSRKTAASPLRASKKGKEKEEAAGFCRARKRGAARLYKGGER